MLIFLLFISYAYVILISVYTSVENSLNTKNGPIIKIDDDSVMSNLETRGVAIDCHPYSGIITKTYDGWKCTAKYPSVFGGPAANKIMTVDNIIIEHKTDGTRIVHTDKIDSTVIISEDPEIELITDIHGEVRYRFTPNDIYDKFTGNKYVSSDGLRFYLIKNVCAEIITNDKSMSVPDYKSGKCKCRTGFHQLTPDIFTCVPDGHSNNYVSVAKIPCVSAEFISDKSVNSTYITCPQQSEIPYRLVDVSLAYSRTDGLSETLLQAINSY